MKRTPSPVSPRFAAAGVFLLLAVQHAAHAQWLGYAGDPLYTALSAVASQPLGFIKWQTPVDLAPQYSGTSLLIHYGSPVITVNNTVIVPVKTAASGGFQLSAFDGATGTLKWTQSTDYTLPPSGGSWPTYSWPGSYGPSLSPTGSLYYSGSGGTVYTRSSLDSAGSVTPTQLAFYDLNNYSANPTAFDANIAISTPITADAQGDIYFGYESSGAVLPGINNGNPLTSGIARISSAGVGSFFQASDLQVGGVSAGMTMTAMNAAPALSLDGNTLYIAMRGATSSSPGRLVSLNAATLVPINSALLMDPQTNTPARIQTISTASPMVGPDGDVYFGVLDVNGTSRGWMEHFSADLSTVKPTGGFGWDLTPSVVPASMVPSYHGTSSYLIAVKYNNYVQTGGDGVNMIAILDPNDIQIDNRFNGTGVPIMKQILTIAGPTPDAEFIATHPDAVREWCINTTAVDPATDSILVNNEDGKLYRWNLASNSLTQVITLTSGIGEAYTPTLVGSDGAVYAINNATLFSVGTKTFNTSWNGGPGNWSTISQWSTNPQFPNNNTPLGALYNVTINSGGVSLDLNVAVDSLTIGQNNNAYSAQLDLADHKLIVQSADPADKAAKISALNAALIAGSHGSGAYGADWTGNGITSSTVNIDPGHYSIGIFDNAVPAVSLTSFGGQSVDSNSILIHIAHIGDADGNGIVNIIDLSIVANNWETPQNNWAAGDLNGDGIVNIVDFTIVANNWQQTSDFALVANTLLSSAAPVPEPGSITMMFLGAGALLRRRRKCA